MTTENGSSEVKSRYFFMEIHPKSSKPPKFIKIRPKSCLVGPDGVFCISRLFFPLGPKISWTKIYKPTQLRAQKESDKKLGIYQTFFIQLLDSIKKWLNFSEAFNHFSKIPMRLFSLIQSKNNWIFQQLGISSITLQNIFLKTKRMCGIVWFLLHWDESITMVSCQVVIGATM